MSLLLDEVFAGSIAAAWMALVLMAGAVAALWWLALRDRRPRRAVVNPPADTPPRIFDDNATRSRRRSPRPRPPHSGARHPENDDTQVIPVLRDATELIPRVGGERRG